MAKKPKAVTTSEGEVVHKPLPVKGYTSQGDDKVHLVNEGKELYERVHRYLDKLRTMSNVDLRNVSLAVTALEDSGMRAARAVFQPERVKLPEDSTSDGGA